MNVLSLTSLNHEFKKINIANNKKIIKYEGVLEYMLIEEKQLLLSPEFANKTSNWKKGYFNLENQSLFQYLKLGE